MFLEQLLSRLKRRFNGMSDDELKNAILDGLSALGYQVVENVATVDMPLVLAFISYEIATDLATNAASYFSYTDGTESIDKTNVMENFTKLAEKFKAEYDAEIAKREALTAEPLPVFYVMKRVDRAWPSRQT